MNRCLTSTLLMVTAAFAFVGRTATAGENVASPDDGDSWSIRIEPAARATSAVAERSAAYFTGEVVAQQDASDASALPVIQPASRDPFAAQQAQPAEPNAAADSEPADAAPEEATDPDIPVIMPRPVRSPSYMDVYHSIPFLRAEYEANPSYRHEATMEILFGQLRPMTIHKYQPMVPPLRRFPYITPYWYGYDGYRVNYNFFYPRPSVYRHY